jgi:hypothetical protein
MGIFATAWALVLAGAILIFEVIIPYQYCACSLDGVLKGVFVTILGVIWLATMVGMRNLLVKRKVVGRQSPRANKA